MVQIAIAPMLATLDRDHPRCRLPIGIYKARVVRGDARPRDVRLYSAEGGLLASPAARPGETFRASGEIYLSISVGADELIAVEIVEV